MSKTKTPNEFDFESMQDTESIVQYLEALAKGFRAGKLQFSVGAQEMQLQPKGLLKFSVKAERKGGQVRINMQVSWKDSKRKKPAMDELVIRAGKPKDKDGA